jgi:hypothetical protein
MTYYSYILREMKSYSENVNEYVLVVPLVEFGMYESLFPLRTTVFCNSNCILNLTECRTLI